MTKRPIRQNTTEILLRNLTHREKLSGGRYLKSLKYLANIGMGGVTKNTDHLKKQIYL